MSSLKKRINSIDLMRFFAAFAVVCVHCSGYFAESPIKAVSTGAVPLFFMISGYFFMSSPAKSQKKSIRKILILTVLTNLFFLLYELVSAFAGKNISHFLTESFSLKSIVSFLLLNDSPFGGHLWFLSALLYTMVICYFLDKLKINKKILVAVSVIFIAVDVIIGGYGKIFKLLVPLEYIRNFIFAGIPYFLIGGILKNADLNKLNKYIPVVLLAVFAVTSLIEKNIMTINNMTSNRIFYISSPLIALFAFLTALKFPCNNGGKISSFIFGAGMKYSLAIYIIHPVVRNLMSGICKKLGVVNNVYTFIMPIAVFLVSMLIAFIYYKIKAKIISSK